MKREKRIFVVLMIYVPQSNVSYVTNLTISQITNNACLAHIKHLYVKRINIYMKKKKQILGNFWVFFADEKISEVV